MVVTFGSIIMSAPSVDEKRKISVKKKKKARNPILINNVVFVCLFSLRYRSVSSGQLEIFRIRFVLQAKNSFFSIQGPFLK